jgi:DNA-binding IclR family transcriptional regulator
MQILDTFRTWPEQSITEIAQRSGVAKSSALRIAAALAIEGYLYRDTASKRYRLGLRLWELGSLAVQRDSLLQAGRQAIRQVWEATQETVVLAVLDGIDVVYIDKLEGTRAVVARIGGRNPAHAVSSGKALLSCLSDEELRRRFPQKLPTFTPHTVSDRDRLIGQIRAIRENGGLVVNRGEFRPNVGGIAMAIEHPRAQPASIGLSCPLSRLTPDTIERYTSIIRRAARFAGNGDYD